jgi:phosphotransferase family enzyme
MIYNLLENLTGIWSKTVQNAEIEFATPLSAIQIGGFRGKDRKVSFLIFDKTSPSPVLVLKTARSDTYRSQLERGFENLIKVKKISSVGPTTPTPVGIFEYEDHLISAESFSRGTSLSLLLRRGNRTGPHHVEEDFQRATNWLERFQSETVSEDVRWNVKNEIERQLAACDLRLTIRFRLDLLRSAHDQEKLSLPVTASHGDFWPGNVLLEPARLSVIDWDYFKYEEWPLLDLFLFTTTYARAYPWKGYRWIPRAQAFQKAFLDENWFSEIIREAVHSYFLRTKLPPAAIHLLFAHFLLHMSKREQREQNGSEQWREFLTLYSHQDQKSIFKRFQ